MSDLGVNSVKFIEPLGAAQKIVDIAPFHFPPITSSVVSTEHFFLGVSSIILDHPFNSIVNGRPSNRRQLREVNSEENKPN
jgi:hypothetical protein